MEQKLEKGLKNCTYPDCEGCKVKDHHNPFDFFDDLDYFSGVALKGCKFGQDFQIEYQNSMEEAEADEEEQEDDE